MSRDLIGVGAGLNSTGAHRSPTHAVKLWAQSRGPGYSEEGPTKALTDLIALFIGFYRCYMYIHVYITCVLCITVLHVNKKCP